MDVRPNNRNKGKVLDIFGVVWTGFNYSDLTKSIIRIFEKTAVTLLPPQ